MKWSDITREDVLEAIRRFLVHTPEHPKSKFTFLLYEGKKLPAKHSRGMAYEVHFQEKASKSDFTGGKETVNFFLRLGFAVEFKGEVFMPTYNPDSVALLSNENIVSDMPVIPAIQGRSESQIQDGMKTRIKIPIKGVIEQKNALQRILNKIFAGDVVCEKVFPWMRTPDKNEAEYRALYETLSQYRGHQHFAKKNMTLRCDFVIEGQKLIIEYDERQHFSEARRLSFSAYANIPAFYDRDLWIRACEDIQAHDNQPADRDEGRAYYDSVRDIAAFKNGYRLVRIMHGRIDFEQEGAEEEVRKMLAVKRDAISQSSNINLKIGMYLQTESYWNTKAFSAAVKKVTSSDIDILVFPEIGWYPFDFQTVSIEQGRNVEAAYQYALSLSRELGCAVVLGSVDADDTIFSLYANASAGADDTKLHIYVKHTATYHSAFEFKDYRKRMKQIFEPIRYKGHKIGLTICYDCNHSIFSRIYGLQGIDIILNSTGGNVKYEKWRKYNKTRAIENHCYTLVTMGDAEYKDNNYVFGFNREGGALPYHPLWGKASQPNIPGMIYIYDLSKETGNGEEDIRLFQKETVCKFQMIRFPVGRSKEFLDGAKQVKENIYVRTEGGMTLVVVVADNENIMLPEKHLPLLYDRALQDYPNKRYLILCRYENLDEGFYREKLSVILKVRAMENYCAVIFESSKNAGCYLPTETRDVQAVKAVNGEYGLDADRMKGPELIWPQKTKIRMKGIWRVNFEWLIGQMEKYI